MSIEILSWNILSGGFKDYGSDEKRPGRIDGLARAIKDLRPDVVSLVDTHKWIETFTVEEIKEIFNYAQAQMTNLEDQRLITKGHENGITVLSQVEKTQFQTFRLATRNAIKTRVSDIDIFCVYLDDEDENTRVQQVKAILELVDTDKPTIIMGDLNTIDNNDLAKAKEDLDVLSQRFPVPMKSKESALNEMKKGEVGRILKENGFTDLGAGGGNTFPTKLFPLAIDRPILRLDYVFANRLIKLEQFMVLTDNKYENLSDHYPLLLRVSTG